MDFYNTLSSIVYVKKTLTFLFYFYFLLFIYIFYFHVLSLIIMDKSDKLVNTYVVQLNFSNDYEPIRAWREQNVIIDDYDPNKPIPSEAHITLHIGLDKSKDLQPLFNYISTNNIVQFPVVIDKIGLFNNRILYATPTVVPQSILDLHNFLEKEYDLKWDHEKYIPHITLAYLKPDTSTALMVNSGQIQSPSSLCLWLVILS
jgi:hypothetical protein